MLGWYVDIILDFLLRALTRWIKSYRSGHWPVVEANLAGSQVLPHGIGCYKTEQVYTYSFRGQFYGGNVKKPFLSKTSAEEYAAKFAKGSKLEIRVNAENPETSFVRDEDQV